MIRSFLDTDLYKLSMCQAVFFGKLSGVCYQDIDVDYSFINRGKTKFPIGFDEQLKEEISRLSDLQLSNEEHLWLLKTCPYLKRSFLDFLRGFRFRTDQVKINQCHNELYCTISGPWYETILYEVMIMAIISELYYKTQNLMPENVVANATKKMNQIKKHNITVADFGTRRRFSYDVQKDVVATLVSAPTFVGTSNVHLAMKYNIKPIGTHAHEWFSAHGSLFGYKLANHMALQAWAEEFQGDLGIALSDTFTTDVFMRSFNKLFSKQFDGVRHDSGSCIDFATKVIEHYKKLGIDPLSKTIVFSDGLNVDKAVEINEFCRNKIKCAFGIGTNLTNDVGHSPLNIVIKLVNLHYKGNVYHTVKLSDVSGKETGDINEIDLCKRELGIS